MASACVNNIGMSPESFIDLAPATYGWLSPRISFSRDDDSSKLAAPKQPSPAKSPPSSELPDLEAPAGDFEFRLEDPVAMLPADELFSDGKLVPLQLSSVKPQVNDPTVSKIRSPECPKTRRRPEISSTDPYLFSPKAPRCSSRWKDLLGLKKLYHNSNPKPDPKTTPSSTTTTTTNPKSLKHFLQRSSKSATSSSLSSLSSSYDASLSLPLLKDTDSSSSESLLSSSRFSLSSSSSSGHELEDLPRLSLDSEKQNPNPISIHRNPPKMRPVKPKQTRQMDSNGNSSKNVRTGRSFTKEAQSTSRGVSVDSPRMNSSGKIVFQSLERSSSSPSSFNGGPRFKHRGMERSYSANVRVTPVLNVPVCSLRGPYSSKSFGFGQLFSSPQKRETGGNSRGHSYYHSSNSKNRTDRI
ncbi:uncharacterized protein LOC142617373 [Castanea sativa]|uniref:uncharacterized protein LOC142617373 n=1 Tax=Castanea sativa TaxID=21020 RepID=UPI003F654963